MAPEAIRAGSAVMIETRSVEFLEQGATGDPEPTDHSLLVELPQHLADHRWKTAWKSDPALGVISVE